MKRDWLWDRKISIAQARSILRDPRHPKFLKLAALLLARKNRPAEVFKADLSAVDFCRNWQRIKPIMRKDAWGESRTHFWQAVFEKVKEKLKRRGTVIRPAETKRTEALLKATGKKLKDLRQEKRLTQRELARKLKISQQIISRVESGQQNISLLTLKEMVAALQAKVNIEFK